VGAIGSGTAQSLCIKKVAEISLNGLTCPCFKGLID
jgi:hypothetical protein